MRSNHQDYCGVFTIVLYLACQIWVHADQDPAIGYSDQYYDPISAKHSDTNEIFTDNIRSLFEAGDFDQLLEKAQDHLLSYDSESHDLDAIIYFAGSSHYCIGNHRASHILLNSYSSRFPDSEYLESAQFYFASNLIKLHWWRAASLALDDFINRHPDSKHLSHALYDRASADYFFEDYNSCLGLISKIEQTNNDRHLDLRIRMLKGYALKASGRLAESEGAFLIAKNKAELLGSSDAAARALINLIDVSAEQGRWRDSSSYYYTFMNGYKDTDYAISAAAAGIKMMKQMEKEDEVMGQFTEIFSNISNNTNAKDLNDALSKYSTSVQERYGTQTILTQLGNFLGQCEGPPFVREALVLAQLKVLEKYVFGNEQEIDVYYGEIIKEFDLEYLSSPAILKLASYYLNNDQELASELYQEVLGRGNSRYVSEAIFGIAKIQSLSTDQKKLKSSIFGFRQVIELYGHVMLGEDSLSELDKLLENNKDLSDSEEILMSRAELMTLVGEPRRIANKKILRN